MKESSYRFLIVFLLLVLLSFFDHLSAATLHVPADFSNIQEAVDAAVSGDTVLLADGVYSGEGNENIYIIDKSIDLRSENGADQCILHAVLDDSVIVFQCENSKISELTIRSSARIAIRGAPYSENTIENCLIRDCVDRALHAQDAHMVIRNCQFINNTSIFLEGVFESPTIYLHGTRSRFENCLFDSNTYPGRGGVIYAWRDYSEFINCTFINNSSDQDGGAIYANSTDITLNGCSFINNTASWDGGALNGTFLDIQNCHFLENQAYFYGGAIANENSNVSQCHFENNTASDGGAISVYGSYSPTFNQCLFTDNTAERGGVIYLRDGRPTVTNCIFDGNGHSLCLGGVVYMEYYGDNSLNETRSSFVNNLFINNMASDAALVFGDRNSYAISVTNSIIRDNSPDQISNQFNTQAYFYHCNIQDGYPGPGNIDADPQFTSSDDFHLTSTSPCIDTGWTRNAPTTDYDSQDRPQGITVDIGPFEYPGYHQQRQIYLSMPDHQFSPGETCNCSVTVWNPETEYIENEPLFVILDVYDTLYFAPAFNEVSYFDRSFPPGETTTISVLDDFSWPDHCGTASGLFWYAALTNPQITELTSTLALWEFGWCE